MSPSACPPLPVPPSVSPAAGGHGGGIYSSGKGCDRRLAPNAASACGLGPGGVLIQQISPGISTWGEEGGGLWGAGSSPCPPPLLANPPGKRGTAQPWPEANTCAGQGFPTLGASGRARGQAGCGGTGGREVRPRRQPRWAGRRRDTGTGWGDPLSRRVVHPTACQRAREPGIPSPYRGGSHPP